MLRNEQCFQEILDLDLNNLEIKACDMINQIQKNQKKIDAFSEENLRLGRLVDLFNLRKKGFSAEKLTLFWLDDEQLLKEALAFKEKNHKLRNYMFGFPANMTNDSYLVQYFKQLEQKLFLINNCGSIDNRGFYQMDNKDIEKAIVKTFFNHLGIPKTKQSIYTGYVTSGGSEGNFWGLREGFKKYPNAVMYYSNQAHYSVDKYVSLTNSCPEVFKIADKNGIIDEQLLVKQIKMRWSKEKKPAVILLNWGVTKNGALDNIKSIKESLLKTNIPHYIHLDAAFYGGVPKNQTKSPKMPIFFKLDINSISISFHKYIGINRVHGIVIGKKHLAYDVIDYIGQEDNTILSSRDFPPFSSLQKIKEVLERSASFEYLANVEYFKKQAEKYNLSYELSGDANIFVIKKPANHLCVKYQLSTFFQNEIEKAHIIILPFHEKPKIVELIKSIVSNSC